MFSTLKIRTIETTISETPRISQTKENNIPNSNLFQMRVAEFETNLNHLTNIVIPMNSWVETRSGIGSLQILIQPESLSSTTNYRIFPLIPFDDSHWIRPVFSDTVNYSHRSRWTIRESRADFVWALCKVSR